MSALHFDLTQWIAWAPGRHTPSGEHAMPVLDFLPAMQRRRLSPLARICFHICWQMMAPEQTCGLVFCSRHGETQRTLDMLHNIIEREPVSPTAFSHSVHNAIPALLSIARNDISEQVTLAQQGQDGLAAAFLEASMMLESGSVEQVVILCCDEPLPELFRRFEPHAVNYPWATAFRLQAGQQWSLSALGSLSALAAPSSPTTPAPLQLIDALERHAPRFDLHNGMHGWAWRQAHA